MPVTAEASRQLRPAAPAREIAEIDEEGNITSNGHLSELSASKVAISPVKTRTRGKAAGKAAKQGQIIPS